MNELGNIGFTYDIKTFTPDGEKKDDFSVHNLITDEGLRWVVARIFAKDTNAPSFFYETRKYSQLNSFNISFMTTAHTPNAKFDSFPTFIQEVNEASLRNLLVEKIQISENSYIYEISGRFIRYIRSENINKQTNTLKLTSGEYSDDIRWIFCKTSPVILTGVFIIVRSYEEYNEYDTNFGEYQKTRAILLSEAMFPEPILLEVGGKLQVNCGCTVISA